MSKPSNSKDPQDKSAMPAHRVEDLRTGGYQPLKKGYSGDLSRGYSATNSQPVQQLPKPPEGGTAITPPSNQGGEEGKG